MSISYSQLVSSMYVDSANIDTPNLVTGVYILITAMDHVTQISSSLGVYIKLESSSTFTAFEELTSEIVSSWVDGNPMVESAKSYLVKQIEEKRSSSSIGLVTPPWHLSTLTSTVQIISSPATVTGLVSVSNTGTEISEVTEVTII